MGKGGQVLNMNRRTFLKLSALTGAAVGLNSVTLPAPVFCAPRSPRQSQGVINEKWIPTSCLGCSGRCAIKVRVVNDRAVKITGNPSSSLSGGKVCPRAHIGLQILYDPQRVGSPLKRRNREKGRKIDPQWSSISWDQALKEIEDRLRSLREVHKPHQLLMLHGLNSKSTEDLILRFGKAFGTPNIVSGDGLDGEAEKAGNWMADGHYEFPSYDLDRTQYLLLFGADLLESGRPLSHVLRKWGRIRRERPNRAKIVMIHPRYSVTAAKSDEWVPISPGTEGALAMGLASIILQENLYDKAFIERWAAGFENYRKVVSQYPLEQVSKMTGIPSDIIQRLAKEFAMTKPAIAIGGKGAYGLPEGSYNGYAIHCLNGLVGSIDIPGGVLYQEKPNYKELTSVIEDGIAKKGRKQPAIQFGETERFLSARSVTNNVPESILKKMPYSIQMAIGFNCNFIISAPSTKQWEEAMKKVPFYVHLSPFVSEMALYADILLPTTTYLEEWGYDHSSQGAGFAEMRIKQPVVKPHGETKSSSDILLILAKGLGGSVEKSFASLGDGQEAFVKFRTSSLIAWKDLLAKGVWIGPEYQYEKYDRIFNTSSKRFEFSSRNLETLLTKGEKRRERHRQNRHQYDALRFLGKKENYPFVLHPYQPLMALEHGSQNYPWAQEIYLPLHGTGWDTLVEINRGSADRMGIRNGDEVWVESPFSKIRARAKCSEGLHPEVIAIPCGQGHYAYGQWQKGIGVNPYELIGADFDGISGQASYFNTRVKVYKA
jgi:anaerobic selenocysteine-containing dehydrogenase